MTEDEKSLKKHSDMISDLVSALRGLVPEFGTVEETPELQAARTVLHDITGKAT